MSRSSQTEVAILGGLSVTPMTGYALRAAIRDVLGHFWSESFGQIYPALAELERGGYVRRLDAARPGASAFTITETGAARLRDLLAQPIQPTPPRNGLMLRLFFGRHLGPAACRELVLQAKAQAERDLERFAAIRAEDVPREQRADQRYWLLTVSAGEHGARATIDWASETLAALDAIDPPGRTREGTRDDDD